MLKKTNFRIGTTTSGKAIYREPSLNSGFKHQDHMEAYRAHAKMITYQNVSTADISFHRTAMDKHFKLAAQAQ